MANVCPLKFLPGGEPNPDWVVLVQEFGEAGAQTAFAKNNYTMPTPKRARDIIERLRVQEPENRFNESSPEFKLQRNKAQRTYIDQVLLGDIVSRNPLQKQTLEKIRSITEFYNDVLGKEIAARDAGEKPARTISVTNFIGSSDYKATKNDFESFKLFGTFMHNLLDSLQNQATRDRTTSEQLLTREFFDNFWNQTKEKERFVIANMPHDLIFEMAQKLAQTITTESYKNYVILPEITLAAENHTGSVLVGRLDLLLVDSDGNAIVYDFKTKKVKSLVERDSMGAPVINTDAARRELASKEFLIDKKTGQTAAEFQNSYRTPYDTWVLQLKTYENMLLQHGVPVKNSTIISLLYQADEEQKFEGYALQIFDGNNFYASAGIDATDINGHLVEVEKKAEKLKKLRGDVDKLVPISKEAQAESEAQLHRTFPFDTTEKQNQRLTQALKNRVDADMKSIEVKLQELRGSDENSELVELYKRRRETLKTFRDIIEAHSDTWGPSMKLKLTTEHIEVDIKNIESISQRNFKLWEEEQDPRKKSQLIKLLTETYSQSQDILPVYNLLKEVVADAVRDESVHITRDSNIQRLMDELAADLATIESNFRQVGLHSAVQVISSLGAERFRSVGEKMKQGLDPKIAELTREINSLLEGMPVGFFRRAGTKLLAYFNEDYRRKAAEALSNDELKARAGHIETLKLQREKYLFLTGQELSEDGEVMSVAPGSGKDAYEFTDENIKRFVEAVSEPTSIMYIGQSDLYNDLFTIRADQFMAGASNSDPGLAGLTILLKEAQAAGVRNMMDSMEEQRVGEKLSALLEGRSVEDANDALQEIRTITYKNKDGELITRNERTYVKLVSVAYEQELRDFKQTSRELTQLVNSLKNERIKYKPGTDEYREADMHLTTAISDREDHVDRYERWLKENTSRPFKDEFYEIQSMIGVDFREKLQKLYLENDLIVRSVGLGNEEQLDEDAYDRMREIGIEIKQLRIEASKENPDWEKYMKMLDDFFEYQPNLALFTRVMNRKKIEYADDPAGFQKWKEENMVYAPTSEWYQEIEDIYTELGDLFAQDPVMSEMIKERSQIMSPYKRDGRFDPTYLSDKDAQTLSDIEYRLNRYRQAKREDDDAGELTEEQKQELSTILNRLKSMSESSLNPHYQKMMDKMTVNLLKKKAQLDDAKRQVAVVDTGVESDALTEAKLVLQHEEGQFRQVEDEYRNWYNKNHNDKYVSVRKGNDPRDAAQPRSFNFEKLPPVDKRAQYMSERPSGKWSVRKEKPEALNPDYQEAPDGMALPKGVTFLDGHYQVDESKIARDTAGNPLYVNPKYVQLTRDKQAFAFYNAMMPEYFKLQRQTTGRKIGYKVPGFEAHAVENFARLGVGEAVKKTWKSYVDEKFKGNSQYDQVTNFYGESGDKLRFRNNRQLDESVQSADAINCMIKWMSEAHYNKAMANAQPVTDSFIQYMKVLRGEVEQQSSERTVGFEKRLGDLNNIISLMENERNKFVKGQFAEPGNKRVRKALNQVFQFTSFARIGFDVANQAKNYLAGNVQAWLAAAEKINYNDDDLKWAKSQIYGREGFFANYLADWGLLSGLSVQTMLYRAYNPAQKDFQKYLENTTGGKSRRLLGKVTSIQELAYGLQDKGDTEIAMSVWLAIMHANKFRVIARYDESGKPVYALNPDGTVQTVNALEAYGKDEQTGKLIVRKDVEFTAMDESIIRHKVYSEMRKAQGNYAKSDQTKNEAGLFGPVINYFRKYMVSQALTRLGHLRPDWEGSNVHYGYMRVMLAAWKYYGPKETTKHLLLGGFTPKWIKNSKMNDLYSSKLAHASRDLIVSSVLMMLSLYALSIVKQRDKDDEELGMAEGNLIRVLWAVKNETISMNPIPVFGGTDEYIKSFTSLTSLTREFTGMSKIIGHGLALGYVGLNGGEEPDPEMDSTLYQLAYKSGFYARDQGPFEKGDPKFYKDLSDLTGYKNIRDFFHPGNRIDNAKKLE